MLPELASRKGDALAPALGCGPDCPVNTGAALMVKGRRFDELEREIYVVALRDNGGSRRRAAQALGIARSTFCERLKRFGCITLDPDLDKVSFW